jgi:cytochrome c
LWHDAAFTLVRLYRHPYYGTSPQCRVHPEHSRTGNDNDPGHHCIGTGLPVGRYNDYPADRAKEEMVAFVQEAVSHGNQKGKEKALAEFSNPKGSFFRGVFYIYAYGYNGTTIAHPVNPEKIGVNRLNEKDSEGNLFITDLRQAAYNGTGFTTFTYINPVHNNTVEKKLGYVMKVDDSRWLGSGFYIGPARTSAPVTTTQPG